jgi:hypothetical protein
MLRGISLTVMIGPAVPVPAPRAVVEALSDIEVTVPKEGPTVFQMRFSLEKRSPLETLFLLSGGSVPPLLRVVLVAIVNGLPEVLADGVVTGTEIAPASEGNLPTLTVRGEDLSRVMDYVELDGMPYPAMPPQARVLKCLAKYAAFGVAPLVIPPLLSEVPVPVERIPIHQGTDLAYIQYLAEQVGHIFYVEAGPAPGSSLAYWGPKVKLSVPQPALNVDMDAHTNVEGLSFSLDTEDRTVPVLFILHPKTKATIPVPVPDSTPLTPPLGLVPPLPKRFEMDGDTGHLSPIEAAAVAIARSASSADAVNANGTLDVLRYGRVLKARRLVGVRGGGVAFDGLYSVSSVTHHIKRGEFTQSLSLSRNGLVSTVPRVPV